MKQKIMISIRSLQLFAEGAAGDGGAAMGSTGVTAPAAGVRKGVKNNPLADVKYGVQSKEDAPAAEVQQTTEAKPDPSAEFDRLIKGEFKEQYNARVQDIVRKRLESVNETAQKYTALIPSLEILAQKYGVDPADSAALAKAIEEDDSFFSAEALEKGVSVEELRRIRKIERENAAYRAEKEAQGRKEHAEKQYAAWMQQAEQAKAMYPQLNLETEVKNPQFMRLLSAGIDVGSAYLVIHKDEIIPAAMQHVAQSVEQKLVGKITSDGNRPVENGVKAPGGAVVKNDVTQLSKLDRAEINRRVARGERISFG